MHSVQDTLFYIQLISGWVIAMPPDRLMFIIINNNHHPNTDLPIVRHQRRAVDPPVPALITTELRNPFDTRSDTATGHHSVENVVALYARLSDAIQERGLEHARDLKGRRREQNAKGWIRANEKILGLLVSQYQ